MPKKKSTSQAPEKLEPFFYKGKTWSVVDGGLSLSVLLNSETYPHQMMLTKEQYKVELGRQAAEKKNKRVYQDNKYRDYYK